MNPQLAALADSIMAAVRRELDSGSADCGIGTITVINPGSIAGTVAVDTGAGSSSAITMRRSAAYTPTVGDKVRWTRSRNGDLFVDYKLA